MAIAGRKLNVSPLMKPEVRKFLNRANQIVKIQALWRGNRARQKFLMIKQTQTWNKKYFLDSEQRETIRGDSKYDSTAKPE